jgi:pantetheine-phosphate adenylyltransferase
LEPTTDDELLKNKKHASQLEPIEARQEAVRGFVARVGPTGLRTETPRLQDVYGPTATDPTIEGLLVSQETLAGAKAIDAIRSQNGLNSLTTYVIDLISNQLTRIPHDQQDLKDLKISSTQIRAWLDSH